MHRYCFMLQLSFTPKLDCSVNLVCALSRSLFFDVTIDPWMWKSCLDELTCLLKTLSETNRPVKYSHSCVRNGNLVSIFYIVLPRMFISFMTIGNFRVAPSLCFKARLSANPLIWKWFLIAIQIKLISQGRFWSKPRFKSYLSVLEHRNSLDHRTEH